ncbi:MAG: hypothetical protein ACRDRG_04925 [Pseudonocardiaceae bacterium]
MGVWAGPVVGIPEYRTPPGSPSKGGVVVGLIVTLLVLWLVLTVLGFVIKSLFWLAIVGLILFAATSLWAAVRGRRGRSVLR